VTFQPETLTPATGDGWAGISTIEYGLLKLHDADIGYATFPIYLEGILLPEVIGCNIHHYRDEGYIDWGSHGKIQNSFFDRGSELLDGRGLIGIHLAGSAGVVTDNTVSGPHVDYGVKVEFSSGSCLAPLPPATPRTLNVSRNVVDGARQEPMGEGGTGAQTGIFLSWVCDSVSAVVDGNTAQLWERGLSLYHCADTDVSCGTYNNNFVGLQYQRGVLMLVVPGEDSVKVNQTSLKDNFKYSARVPSGLGLKLGDTALPPDPGRNALQLDQTDANSMYLQVDVVDPDNPYASLSANRNTWRKANATIETDVDSIRAHVDEGSIGLVSVSFPRSTETLCSGTTPVLVSDLGPEVPGRSELVLAATALPLTLGLTTVSANPSRSHLAVQLEVPAGETRFLQVDVYDVTGRHVRSLYRGYATAGRHVLGWDGSNRSGARVAPGGYFVRLAAGEFRQTRKLVLVR
jgi:hypothetical protein